VEKSAPKKVSHRLEEKPLSHRLEEPLLWKLRSRRVAIVPPAIENAKLQLCWQRILSSSRLAALHAHWRSESCGALLPARTVGHRPTIVNEACVLLACGAAAVQELSHSKCCNVLVRPVGFCRSSWKRFVSHRCADRRRAASEPLLWAGAGHLQLRAA